MLAGLLNNACGPLVKITEVAEGLQVRWAHNLLNGDAAGELEVNRLVLEQA